MSILSHAVRATAARRRSRLVSMPGGTCEPLESRRLLSAGVAAADPTFELSEAGVLTVTATSGADTVRVAPNGDGDSIDVIVNGAIRSFTRAGLTRIDVLGQAGDDVLTTFRGVDVPVNLVGGDGNDTLDARDGVVELVDGGAGNDSARADADDRLVNVETARGGTIRGVAYEDVNANGARDPGEPGLAGVTVGAIRVGGTSAVEVTTGPDGAFVIDPEWVSQQGNGPITLDSHGQVDQYNFNPFDGRLTVPIPGPSDSVVQFGYVRPYTGKARVVTGRVVADAPQGPVPLAGFTVFHDANDNGALDAGEISARTELDGTFALAGLPEGTQTVRVLARQGVAPSEPGGDARRVTLTIGATYPGNDFHLQDTMPAAAGAVFNDLDGDRVKDANEPSLPGFTLYDDFNRNDTYDLGEDVGTTGPDGSFRIRLWQGTHRLAVRAPAWWVATAPAAVFRSVTLGASDTQDLLFGMQQLAPSGTVRGTVINDLDADGVRDPGEPGIPGAVVYIDGASNNGGPPTSMLARTDANGNYEIEAPANGDTHVVQLYLPPDSDYFRTSPPGPGFNHLFSVAPGQAVGGKDFLVSQGSAIEGVVYNDRNFNGRQDPGEEGLAGIEVGVGDRRPGMPDAGLGSTVTDATGHYAVHAMHFPGGRVGVVALPRGMWLTGEAARGILERTLGFCDQTLHDVNFGMAPGMPVYGVVYKDVNLDHQIYQNDPLKPYPDVPLAGWTVYSDANGNGTLDAGERSTLTDANGAYVLAGLPIDLHTIRASAPVPGFAPTAPGGDAALVDFRPYPQPLPAAFAFSDVGQITGMVFDDADGDSVIEPGEGPLPGATVFLDENANGYPDPGERAEASGADGRYTFDGLAPGTYFLNIFEAPGTAETVRYGGGGYNVRVEAGRTSEAPPFALTRTSVVVGSHVFYNHSVYDGNDGAANAADDAAVAPDKVTLREGGPLSTANVTNYVRGINGVMIDIAGLPQGATLTPADFTIGTRVDGGNYSGWTRAQAPSSVSVRRGAGTNGSDRVTLIWPDDTFRNIWVRVLMMNNERTGLYRAKAVYFGNLVGETDASVPAGSNALRVNALDLAAVKRGLNRDATLTSRLDFNRDGRVNALDLAIVKSNLNRVLPVVRWPGPAAEPPAAAAASGEEASLISAVLGPVRDEPVL